MTGARQAVDVVAPEPVRHPVGERPDPRAAADLILIERAIFMALAYHRDITQAERLDLGRKILTSLAATPVARAEQALIDRALLWAAPYDLVGPEGHQTERNFEQLRCAVSCLLRAYREVAR